MGLKDVMKYLQQRDPDTPDTSRFGDTQESEQFRPVDEASNDPEASTAKPAPTKRLSYQEWVQTWQPLADAYHAHHFASPTCTSAGKGYGLNCGVGSALWAAYDQAEPSSAKVLARAPIGISTSTASSYTTSR